MTTRNARDDTDRIRRDGDAGARVADSLRAAILAGEYAPGTRLRQEVIADRFGASRVPVREALRTLEDEGLVVLVANTGAWVASLTAAECDEVYQMRERLEPLLLRYAQPHLKDADIEELEQLADRIVGAGDLDVFLALDREFHLRMYRDAETGQLGELVRRLWNTTQPYRRAYTRAFGEGARVIANNEHRLIMASLHDGDVEEAELLLAGHIRRTRRQLARHPELFTPPRS